MGAWVTDRGRGAQVTIVRLVTHPGAADRVERRRLPELRQVHAAVEQLHDVRV